MTTTQKAKEAQGYQAKPVFKMCGNCANYISAFHYPDPVKYPNWVKEIGIRCSIGGYAIKKTSTCNQHKPK